MNSSGGLGLVVLNPATFASLAGGSDSYEDFDLIDENGKQDFDRVLLDTLEMKTDFGDYYFSSNLFWRLIPTLFVIVRPSLLLGVFVLLLCYQEWNVASRFQATTP